MSREVLLVEWDSLRKQISSIHGAEMKKNQQSMKTGTSSTVKKPNSYLSDLSQNGALSGSLSESYNQAHSKGSAQIFGRPGGLHAMGWGLRWTVY